MAAAVDQAFIRQMQKKVEAELVKKEREVLTYWRTELDKTIRRRHQDLAGLSGALADLLGRMDKRLGSL